MEALWSEHEPRSVLSDKENRGFEEVSALLKRSVGDVSDPGFPAKFAPHTASQDTARALAPPFALYTFLKVAADCSMTLADAAESNPAVYF